MKSISTVYVDGKPALPVGQNNGRKIAVVYSVDGMRVMSFPAHLNGGKIPNLSDAAMILRGTTITDAIAVIYMPRRIADCAAYMVREQLEWATPAGIPEGQYLQAEMDGIYLVQEDYKTSAAIVVRKVSNQTWIKCHGVSLVKKVNLAKRPAPAPQFAAPVIADTRTNEQIMLDTLAVLRQKRLSLSTVYTVESNKVVMGSYLAESKPAALDACAREYGYASFAHMETCLGRTLNFDVYAEFVNPLAGTVPA